MSKPTTSKYCQKMYRCIGCKAEKSLGTNHYGECYPYCNACHCITKHKCLEPCPKHMSKPKKWKMIKLRDVVEKITVGRIKK